MKIKYLWLVLLGMTALFFAASCKSAPPPSAQEAAPTAAEPLDPDTLPPDQGALNALNDAAARAAAARKLVNDFEGPSFFPEDWKAADSLYAQAEQQKKTSTLRDTKESTARYNKAADAFEAMTGKTLAAAYEYGERELTAVRNAAVKAGAEELVPDYLLEADNVVLDAKQKYDSKDYYGAKDSALKAYSMYAAGNTGLEAYNVRMEIAGREFEQYDPVNVEIADETMYSAADDYVAGHYGPAKDKADEALLRYNLALKTAWEAYAAEKGANAATERQNALDLKANVAVRQDFNSAQAIYTQANTAFQAKKFDEAGKLYAECGPMFEKAAGAAREKRRIAEEDLRLANQKMEESDKAAKDAEIILEGGAE